MKRPDMPLCDDLTAGDYLTQSAEYISTVLFDQYIIPRPGQPGRLRDSLERLTGEPISAEDSWRRLAMALAREHEPDCKPVFPPAARPFKETLSAPGGCPSFSPGPAPRYGRRELLNMVAAYMARTEQGPTAALDDLFGEDADRPDATSRRRFYTIKKAHPKKWKAVLSSHTACG